MLKELSDQFGQRPLFVLSYLCTSIPLVTNLLDLVINQLSNVAGAIIDKFPHLASSRELAFAFTVAIKVLTVEW